jgi:hypothetical protein
MSPTWTIQKEKMKNSPLNISVSGFANLMTTEPKPVNLLNWLTSDKYKQQVEVIRQAATKEERTVLKQRLPAITPSGTFTERKLSGLVKHSGLLCIDIDNQDNQHIENFKELKRHLCNIQNFAFVGLSVSGLGYYCLVPISEPDQHKAHFKALQTDLLRFGVIIDQSGSDITRLRIYSYDQEPYFNHQAKVYTKIYKEESLESAKSANSARVPNENNFITLFQQIIKTQTDITGGYQTWFEIGCSLANEFGEAGRSYFHDISRFSPKYKKATTDRQFNHCNKQSYRFTINTFFHYCRQANITLDK